jgi:flagellar hook-associated protein 1
LLRAQTAGTTIKPTGGSLIGNIDVRDGEVASLRQNLNTLASNLISEVNTLHRAGYDLNGGTGADFFTGSGASDIAVKVALLNDPSLLQASGTSGATGDNQVVLAMAQLANKPITSLTNQTFSQNYGQTVAALGQAIASNSTRLDDQQSVQTMLSGQRASVSGVSLDEEMTNMMKFQKAYEASARLISVVSQMLDTLMNIQH